MLQNRRFRIILPALLMLMSGAWFTTFSHSDTGGYDSYMIGATCTSGAWVTFETTDPTWTELEWGCDDDGVCSWTAQCGMPHCSGTLVQNSCVSNSYYFMIEIWTDDDDVEISAAGCN